MAFKSLSQGRTAADFWGITCFFNPTRSHTRLTNYRAFRRHLGVPLVCVELAYGSEFELDETDADVLVHLRDGDLLWQKERLLNIALDHLPAACASVAWLDSDVMFERAEWPALVREQLEEFVLVQPFKTVHDFGPGGSAEATKPSAPVRQSLAYQVLHGGLQPPLIATARLRNEWRCAAGLAWAGRREVLERHRFYDACIVGGGDRAIACAGFGSWQGLERTHQMNVKQQEHYRTWAHPFAEAVQGKVGFVEGAIYHLWHGAIQKRGYGTRFAGLAPFAFDPGTDIALSEQGCWRWSSNKPDLHRYVQHYFEQRNDGA